MKEYTHPRWGFLLFLQASYDISFGIRSPSSIFLRLRPEAAKRYILGIFCVFLCFLLSGLKVKGATFVEFLFRISATFGSKCCLCTHSEVQGVCFVVLSGLDMFQDVV